jgi:hypothetical protein
MILGIRHTYAVFAGALSRQSSPGPVAAKTPRLPDGFRERVGIWGGDVGSPALFKQFAKRQTEATKSNGNMRRTRTPYLRGRA